MKYIKGYTIIESIILYTECMAYYKDKLCNYIIMLITTLKNGFKAVFKLFKKIRNNLYNKYHRLKLKIKKYYKEILLIIAFLAGHFLITYGLVDIFGNVVWKFSYGLLLIGLGGFKLMFNILVKGLYIYSQKEKDYN